MLFFIKINSISYNFFTETDMKKVQVLNCSFEKWYSLFKHLTFRSEILPIPDQVVNYLKSDSTIILPKR